MERLRCLLTWSGTEQVGGDAVASESELGHPEIRQVVLDTTDVRGLAEFYRQVFGLDYRPGDEMPPEGDPDPRGSDWLVLRHQSGDFGLAFQQVEELVESTWPHGKVPQQLHLDTSVTSAEALAAQHERVLSLGARLIYDRFDDEEEPLRVYADPAGHPFCIFVAPPRATWADEVAVAAAEEAK
jgi:hypothetical protein